MSVLTFEAIVTVTVLNGSVEAIGKSSGDRTCTREDRDFAFVGGQSQFCESGDGSGRSTGIICGLEADSLGVDSCLKISETVLNQCREKKRKYGKPGYNDDHYKGNSDLFEFS